MVAIRLGASCRRRPTAVQESTDRSDSPGLPAPNYLLCGLRSQGVGCGVSRRAAGRSAIQSRVPGRGCVGLGEAAGTSRKWLTGKALSLSAAPKSVLV